MTSTRYFNTAELSRARMTYTQTTRAAWKHYQRAAASSHDPDEERVAWIAYEAAVADAKRTYRQVVDQRTVAWR